MFFYMKAKGCTPHRFCAKTRGYAEAAREVAWFHLLNCGIRIMRRDWRIEIHQCDELGNLLDRPPFKIRFDLTCTWTNPREVAGD